MRRGFTLIELLIVIVIIAVMAGIVTFSVVDVRKQGRNAQRSTDVAMILKAVYQYALDNNNQLPTAITTTPTAICRTGASSCTGLINLSVLTTSQRYIAAIPIDPQSTSTNSTNYNISRTANGRVTIAAPLAEASTTISVTR